MVRTNPPIYFSLLTSLALFATAAYEHQFLTRAKFCLGHGLPKTRWQSHRRQAYLHLRLLLLLCHHWQYPLLPVLLTRQSQSSDLTSPYFTQLANMMTLLGYRRISRRCVKNLQQDCFDWAKQFHPASDVAPSLRTRHVQHIPPPSDINFVLWTELPYNALSSKRRK